MVPGQELEVQNGDVIKFEETVYTLECISGFASSIVL